MEAFEYAIKKDIRNNPIVREVDEARVREMWRSATVGALVVVILLLSAWQHFELIRYGYRIDQVQKARAEEEQLNRKLRLAIQTLERPDRIEQLATSSLKMQQPAPGDTFILERVQPATPPARSVVAERQ
jgi:cell division protein FtsL